MKYIRVIFTLLAGISLMLHSAYPQSKITIELSKEWKFQTGDHPDFANPDFDDSSWKTIMTESNWESQGYENYDGTGWYRLKVVIPSALKSYNPSFRAIRVALGRIDDNDVAYINGIKIGETHGWDIERAYVVPFDAIRWGSENVIAMKATDTGGGGGMHDGTCSVGSLMVTDFITMVSDDKPSEYPSPDASGFKKTLKFLFRNPVDQIEGTIRVKVFEPRNNRILFTKDEKITVGQQADSIYNFTVSVMEPGNYKINYYFFSDLLPDTSKYSTLFSWFKHPRIAERPENPIVKQIVPSRSTQFALENITLHGYLEDRLNANLVRRLLQIDEKGILEGYYNRPGKQTWVGEYTGKYLHAAVRAWRFSKNEQLKAQMDRIVDILISCQNEDGYMGTYLPENYWTDWDAWAHKYNLLGLLSYYAATGYEPALKASIKMGDLLCRTFGENEGQRDITENSPHVGMASTSVLEPMTELYRYTADKKYLDFCYYILRAYDRENGPKIIETLNTIGKVDKTANAKAYEMMSNLTGIVKMYQLTGEEKLLKAAYHAWNDIAAYKLYITGTSSKGEFFQDDFVLPAENDVHMGEGCVTTTWLQFSQAMYNLTGESKYIDEIEKTIYNHLLAAENPQTGCISYYTALQGKKPYRCTINAHCCLASVPRGIVAIPELIYAKNSGGGFNINMYTAGKLGDKIFTKDGKEVFVSCSIESKFPENGSATIILNPDTKARFSLALRVPAWCRNYKASVDGRTIEGTPGNYLVLEQVWNPGSTVRISFDLNVQLLDGGISYPGFTAIKTGPQILAVDLSLNPQIKDPDKLILESPNLLQLSKTLLPQGWIGSQIYSTKAYYDGKPVDLILVPYADAGQNDGDIRVWIKKNIRTISL